MAISIVAMLPVASGQTREVISDPEAYAVYASVLPDSLIFNSGLTNITSIALLQETEGTMAWCPITETMGKEWTPVWENYLRENSRTRILRPGFILRVPYVLVAPTELQGAGAQAEAFARFPNRHVFTVSAVGFDAVKSRAVVTVGYRCGFSCSGGRHVPVIKENGIWVRAKQDSSCEWVS